METTAYPIRFALPPAGSPPATRAATAAGAWRRWTCALLGHELDNRRAGGEDVRCARCEQPILGQDGAVTHTRHVLGCFLRHHTYVAVAERHGHREYACLRCGHPLLFEVERDPYAQTAVFTKRVRYLCGLLGHRVHEVGPRDGFTEYACGCGHPFLLAARGLRKVEHPLVCVASGHRVSFLARRDGLREHRCRDCGHTFAAMSPGRAA